MSPCSYVIIQISDEWHFCKRELYWSPQTDIVGKELCNSMDLHFTCFSGDLLFNLSRWHKCIVWALPGRQAGKYAEQVSLFVVGKEIFLCCPGPSCSLMWSFSITLRTKGRVTIPNRKNSKRPSIPPSFSENYIAFFLSRIRLHICQEVWGPDSIGIQKCLLQSVSCFDFSQYNCWKNTSWTLKLLFCIDFMIKKLCLKFPKSAI